jgi:energy-coupling factor transport system permease protein
MYAVSQLTRMFTVIILAITIPYTVDPSKYGVIFRGLGLPDKFAYAMDLAFRFIPTLGRDFSITLDAQRARGYEIEKPAGGVLAQIRKLAPLVVPITIGAIVGGEEIIDAMDLRCFGLRPRTWSQQLVYQHRDYLLIAASAIIFFGSAILSALGYGHFWVPDWLLALAR